MKKLFAILALCFATAAGATDWGVLTPGTQYGFTATGLFTDQAEYATQSDFTVTVTGSYNVRCTGGRGANCLYNVADITSIAVLDSVGDAMCTPTQVRSNPDVWTCATSGVAPGTYTILVDGDAHVHTKIQGSDRPASEPYFVEVQ